MSIVAADEKMHLNKITFEENRLIQEFCRNPEFWQEDPFETKILGGIESSPGEYPWAVALFVERAGTKLVDNALCGGTLISQRHVLTARHCVHELDCIEKQNYGKPITWWIQVGGVCTKTDSDHNCSVSDMQRVGVKQAIYSTRNMRACDEFRDAYAPNLEADFAIIELAEDLKPVPFVHDQGKGKNRLQVACLPIHPQLPAQFHIYGWGNTKRVNQSLLFHDYDTAVHLLEIELPTIEGNDTRIPEWKRDYCTHKRLICAHVNISDGITRDSATGDSGNGIVGMHDNKPFLDAITLSGVPSDQLHIGLRVHPLLPEICHHTGVCQQKVWQDDGAQQRALPLHDDSLQMDEVYTYRGAQLSDG